MGQAKEQERSVIISIDLYNYEGLDMIFIKTFFNFQSVKTKSRSFGDKNTPCLSIKDPVTLGPSSVLGVFAVKDCAGWLVGEGSGSSAESSCSGPCLCPCVTCR